MIALVILLHYPSDGTRLVVGEYPTRTLRTGLVQIYDWTGGTSWSQVGNDLVGTAARELFGWSIAFSSDGTCCIAVGAEGENNDFGSFYAGVVQVF